MSAGIWVVVGGAIVLALGVEAAAAGLRRADPGREGPGRPLPWPALGVAAAIAAAIAAARGAGAAAAGMALGGALATVGAILGIELLAAAPRVAPRVPLILLPGLTLVAGAVALGDEVVTRVEGAGLLVLYGIFLYLAAPTRADGRAAEPEPEPDAEAGPEASPPGRLGLAAALGAVGIVAGGAGAWIVAAGVLRVLGATALAPGLVGMAAGVPAAWDSLRGAAVVPGRPPRIEAALDAAAGAPAVLGLAALVAPLTVDAAVLTAYIALCALWAILACWLLISGRGARTLGVLLVAGVAVWARLALHLL